MRLLLNWVLSAIAVWIVAQLVPGISVSGPKNALIAALVIGFINATIGFVLKVITFPLTLMTLGLFWLVINALMLEFASALLAPGFQVRSPPHTLPMMPPALFHSFPDHSSRTSKILDQIFPRACQRDIRLYGKRRKYSRHATSG